ncbi:unnamed protein product [Polarella glacialis]|uniref:Uncharacterized protein n=1 Tax=Polarella glacialis TaxID=89957 RepID=A0A813I3U9_POLGL|nr:unnamed protein product [Polarella glacialis]
MDVPLQQTLRCGGTLPHQGSLRTGSHHLSISERRLRPLLRRISMLVLPLLCFSSLPSFLCSPEVKVVAELLEVLDDLELGMKQQGQAAQATAAMQSIALKFRRRLETLGFSPVKTDGAKFDPNVHEGPKSFGIRFRGPQVGVTESVFHLDLLHRDVEFVGNGTVRVAKTTRDSSQLREHWMDDEVLASWARLPPEERQTTLQVHEPECVRLIDLNMQMLWASEIQARQCGVRGLDPFDHTQLPLLSTMQFDGSMSDGHKVFKLVKWPQEFYEDPMVVPNALRFSLAVLSGAKRRTPPVLKPQRWHQILKPPAQSWAGFEYQLAQLMEQLVLWAHQSSSARHDGSQASRSRTSSRRPSHDFNQPELPVTSSSSSVPPGPRDTGAVVERSFSMDSRAAEFLPSAVDSTSRARQEGQDREQVDGNRNVEENEDDADDAGEDALLGPQCVFDAFHPPSACYT